MTTTDAALTDTTIADVPADITPSEISEPTETPENVQFSVREVPWMKLGKLTDTPKTAAEAATLGGLDFTVELRPIAHITKTRSDDGDEGVITSYKDIPERMATVRTDTEDWLGITSSAYPVLQYRDAFDFMDTISPEYLAAGALKHGKQGFMVVRLPEYASTLTDLDPHEMFIVLRTSHDCSRAIEVSVMPLRQKCMNQLTLRSFAKGVQHRWAVRHTSTMAAKLADAQQSLTNLLTYGEHYEQTVHKLIDVKLTDDQATTVLEQVLPDRPRRNEQVTRLLNSWHTAETVGFDWTGWGLLNAVSEDFDWVRAGGTSESRFLNALQGPTTNTINKVAERLLARV